MSIIAMYRTVEALKKAVGQPFRYIDTDGLRINFDNWAGENMNVISPQGAPEHPDWTGVITLDKVGTLVTALEYVEWYQEHLNRRTERLRVRRVNEQHLNEPFQWQAFEVTLPDYNPAIEATMNWVDIQIWEA